MLENLREGNDNRAHVSVVALPLGQSGFGRARAVFGTRHFLFVSGPFGPFTKQLAARLRGSGARCTRAVFNGGDVLDWGLANVALFRGEAHQWSAWLADTMRSLRITDVVTHGDSHPYCAEAIIAAQRNGLKVHVLEQGYFRPNWITLEQGGVNAQSSLSRRADDYRREAPRAPIQRFTPVGKITPAAVRRIWAYHFAQYMTRPLFPRYQTPYAYTPLQQLIGHARRYLVGRWRKRERERAVLEILNEAGPIFLVLLQRPGDSQLTQNSAFESVSHFIRHLIDAFAKHAPADCRLLFKAHPLDHGLEDHESAMRAAAAETDVSDRVLYIDGGHLPTLARASTGVISVNSTGGLSAIEYGRPTIVLGDAIYDIPGLTHQDGLTSFWSEPQAPDMSLFRAYRRVVMARTQINGAFSTAEGVRLAVPEAARRILET